MKSRPTIYNSNFFRSRLEARWATFFDSLGVEYKFEPKSYRFSAAKLQYIPDFYLPFYKKFVEVKPHAPDEEELEKASLLVRRTKRAVLLVCGDPWPGKYRIIPIVPFIVNKYGGCRPVMFQDAGPHCFGYGTLTKTLYMTYFNGNKLQLYPLQTFWKGSKERIVPIIFKADAPIYISESKRKLVEVYFDLPTIWGRGQSPLIDAFIDAQTNKFRRSVVPVVQGVDTYKSNMVIERADKQQRIVPRMAKNKDKFYVVWDGWKPGIYTNWNDCSAQVTGFSGAKYKSFDSLDAARLAFQSKYEDFAGKQVSKSDERHSVPTSQPIIPSYCVDAACAGNPGPVEYRCVETDTGGEIFRQGPFQNGTNNIGEFLAIVHALAQFKKDGIVAPIYSDSKTAIGWIREKKCKTKLEADNENSKLFNLIKRAEIWLHNNDYTTEILHWQTEAWGQIPADFGRK